MVAGVADVGDQSGSVVAVCRLLDRIEQISQIGSWEWVIATGAVTWSDQLYRIYGVEHERIQFYRDVFDEHLACQPYYET